MYDELSRLDDEQSPTAATRDTAVAQALPEVAEVKVPAKMTPRHRGVKTGVVTQAHHDTVASLLEQVDVAAWRDVLAETETHHSTYRLTEQERRVIEDVVRDLWRDDHIKTSMNELARLGLLLLADDYRRRKSKSIIHRVKKP